MFLWLDDNNITTINKEAFRNCFLLTDIRLDHNQIEDIDKETFKDLSDLASIYLHNNKFKQQQDDEKRLELYFEKKLNFISLNNNNDENCIHLLKKVLV
jgi:Leucine-rich repeat (LRR) protein